MGEVESVGMSLQFIDIPCSDRQSVVVNVSNPMGVYAYEFADGTWYVGKTTNVCERHAAHLHEWKHDGSGRVPVRLLWHEVDDVSVLDDVETEAIRRFEAHGHKLWNVMKTGLPRNGAGDIVVFDDMSIHIPWELSECGHDASGYAFTSNEAMAKKWERLRRVNLYPMLRDALVLLVGGLIPDSVKTAGVLWTLTALPSTNGGGRLACLSCGNLEILVVFRDGSWFINGKCCHDICRFAGSECFAHPYRFADGVHSIWSDDLRELMVLLLDDEWQQCCYRLIAECMRKGPSMYRRFHNPYFAKDVLDTVVGV